MMMDMVMIRLVAILRPSHVNRKVEHALWTSCSLPACHSSKRFDAPVDIALAIEELVMGVLNHLSLSMQVRQRIGTNGLGFASQRLACLQPLSATVQTFGAGKKLLPLLKVSIRGSSRLIPVPRPE